MKVMWLMPSAACRGAFANRFSDNRHVRPATVSGCRGPLARTTDRFESSVGGSRRGDDAGIPARCKHAAEVGTASVGKGAGNKGRGRSGSMRLLRRSKGLTLEETRNAHLSIR